MNETQPLQTDIFGETHSLEDVPSLEPPKPRPVGGTQARLFEPQMEGQFALEMRTAPEGAGRGATTTTEGNG